jgi:hypothetical protein
MIEEEPFFKPKHALCKILKLNQDFSKSIYLFLAELSFYYLSKYKG